MNKPLVSILINNYNYGQFLSDAIDSALNQEYLNVEVIVVDDGSSDNSRDIIEGYGKQIIAIFKDNGGQSSAFNAGFHKASGDIICFLDSDDFFETNKVGTIVNAFIDNPECGFIVHKMQYIDNKYNFANVKEHDNQVAKYATSGDYRKQIIDGQGLPGLLPATSALCFRKTLLEKFCPIPNELKITADNYLKAAGVMFSPLVLLDHVLSSQRIHGGNAYTNLDRNTKQFRKKVRKINKEIALGLYGVLVTQKASNRYLFDNIKSSFVDFDAHDFADSFVLFVRLFLGRLSRRWKFGACL